ncbi:LutB/LldF family L-lactate oxidation iron-sulfur protein [Marinomonas sp. 15G1-11]|uniref:LutB/LldF family L-lactate oxidation iron-sulfur protein n=1 Tax=Marinomonas phaeophyticola TaxID=3004091 RepID=A0ABT4JY93_9GAMM|nr:LutB/LldF family L-lactate oxidation iron-sulfur protein [Marinomonas sp. 15G1-11]MCZ2723350.1 LutB/LldF family L-lactate oxidation iron-sulfur protein [Marinomonas sp. 15G1-11]
MSTTTGSFQQRSDVAIQDKKLRANFLSAMDGLMEKRDLAFDDKTQLEALRILGAQVRQNALVKLPELLVELETKLTQRGVQVHWAQTPDEAVDIIQSITLKEKAQKIIKGKSMVSEEIHLNDKMEQVGVTCLESDLGEYIVQLAKETPSHIVMPAIHKNTAEIADLLHEKTGIERKEDALYMTEQARQQLRKNFMEADIGLSGVNFAVAETGTLCLVENEGNGRLTTTVPKTHIAIMGIEKVVEKLEDTAPLLSLLTRSATGQPITTYFNMISGPRKENELDGPETVHLVLLDHGRTQMYQDDELLDTLRCIRCAACMNHCPVYTRIGGHAYGFTYPGPIGKILMPHLEGLDDTQSLPTASSLCGACAEVCPVKIPIPDLLVRLREEANHPNPQDSYIKGAGIKRHGMEPVLWSMWRWWHQRGTRYHIMTSMLTKLHFLQPSKLAPWTNKRTLPKMAKKSFHQQMKARTDRLKKGALR